MRAVDRPGDFSRWQQDTELVSRCLAGDQTAWDELIEKYKGLIYSIPVKYGFNRENASEIFQSVCLKLVQDLDNLREPQALAAWLITTTSRKCSRFLRDQNRAGGLEPQQWELLPEPATLPDEYMDQLRQEQLMRDAVRSLSPPCRELVNLLFLSEPPISYDEAAQRLGLAKGSMGATRMRCLEKLRRWMEERGLR